MHLLITLLAAISPALPAPSGVGLSEAEMAEALAGKVPTRSEAFTNARGKSAGRGIGAIVIDRPVADVWATLSHYEDRAEYVPHLKKVTVLDKQSPTRLRVCQEIDATVTTARYTAWYDLDAVAHVIHWKMDDTATTNTLVDVDGDYRMFDLGPARTLLVYRSYVDTGLKLTRFIQSYIATRSMPDLLRAIKKRVESGGKWKKT